MVGTEVLQQIKLMLPATRVILMTAFASIDLAVAAMRLGASDFVRKPMTPDILRNAVAAALSKEADHDSLRSESLTHDQPPRITLNGFTILRDTDMLGGVSRSSNERSFTVRAPNGREQEVVVDIARGTISTVEAITAELPLTNNFRTEQAEQFLSDFCGTMEQFPPAVD
jgi:DNA-binding NarL/FixJ family response regulator